MKPQLIYIHGGEAFDQFLPGFKSMVLENVKKLYQHKTGRWPDTLNRELPDWEVIKLKMPGKYDAKYSAWKKYFESQFDNLEDEVVLLGWSLGANFLAKYLSENQFPKKIKSLHLVAGCYGCPGGFGLHKKLDNVSRQCAEVYLYHSHDDFVVDFSDAQKYQKELPNAQLHEFTKRNHFLQPEFPELMERIKL